jgi:carboxypeptidase C (cathepsin A)
MHRLSLPHAFALLMAAFLAMLLLAAPVAVTAQERPAAVAGQKANTPDARKPDTGKTDNAKSGDGKSDSSKSDASKSDDGKSRGADVLTLLPPDSITEHTLTIPGGSIAYTATAGTLNLFGQTGDRTAAIFYTAYVAKTGVVKSEGATERPVTFIFNGGPGAASAYLHLGLVGPKILDFGPDGRDGATAKLVDNPESWLAFTDLVLIDPIGTGWSRTAKADDASNFYGVRQDASAMAKIIALYVAHNHRAASPKYLLGESYGGVRAAKTAETLRQDQGIIVSGIVMLSPLIDGSLIFNTSRSALGTALRLPSLAAAELERHRAFSTDALAEAERFALTDYLTTLAGPWPTGDAVQPFYARIAQLTGLPVDVVARTRGFVGDAYIKHLRESDHAVVSQYDATLATPDPYPESEIERGPDPVLDGFTRAYGGAFVTYARDELGFKTEMTYTLLARDVNGKWDWSADGKSSRSQISVSDDLRELLSLDPSFRLLVAHGTSDLVTPYAANKYVIDHLPPSLAANRATLKIYRGGHMLYTVPSSRLAFTADAKAFYEAGNSAKE